MVAGDAVTGGWGTGVEAGVVVAVATGVPAGAAVALVPAGGGVVSGGAPAVAAAVGTLVDVGGEEGVTAAAVWALVGGVTVIGGTTTVDVPGSDSRCAVVAGLRLKTAVAPRPERLPRNSINQLPI